LIRSHPSLSTKGGSASGGNPLPLVAHLYPQIRERWEKRWSCITVKINR